MVLDTSAIVAFFEREPEAERVAAALLDADRVLISAATVVEAGIVLEARRGEAAGRELDLFLHRIGARIVAVDAEHAEVARAAWRQFGKSRHRAGLNYGDCFAYALAALSSEPLLFIGSDFARTDIPAAPY